MTGAPQHASRGQLRLPGSVAEVDASPEGPQIGAFFDLDGTLVAGFTVAAITRDRLRRREVGAGEFLHMMQLAVEYRLGRRQFENVIEGAVRSSKGRLAEDVDEMGERIFRQSIADLIYPEMRDLVHAHQRRGHTVVLSSSALSMQAVPVARYLGIDHVVCNRFVVDEHGVLTGEIERPVIWGTTKATSVQRFAAEHQVDLRSSYFYADGDEDLALMHLVGNPRPVNPGPELSKVAARRGWPVLRFSSRDSGSPLAQVRTLASIGSLGPLAAGALGIGVLTRNKRTGVNFLTRYWPETLLALSGVKLNVTGAENLTARRPAVFLFNHRNNFDVFMVAALVRDNWTGVAKIELERNPLVGPLGKLMDTAFIDRADSAAAVAALKGVEEAAAKGLSIVIAPEGSRMDAQAVGPLSVGPFKKGAFRIAMATGLPIVPIVIRNSDSVAGRNTYRLNPGTVDIAVLPPIDVGDWTHEELPKLIEQVRTRYLETLADWPVADPDGAAGAPRPAAGPRPLRGRKTPHERRIRPGGTAGRRHRYGAAHPGLDPDRGPADQAADRRGRRDGPATGQPRTARQPPRGASGLAAGRRGRRPAGSGQGRLAARGACRPPCGEARRHHARARPVSPQRTSAAADPGPPAGPRRRARRRARDGRLAAAALGRGYRRR